MCLPAIKNVGLSDLRGLSDPSASVAGKPVMTGQQRLMCHEWDAKGV